MSDSESDEEFLSADEGDYEDGAKTTVIDEEEVDEIMDILMNNHNIESNSVDKQKSSIRNTKSNQLTNQVVEPHSSLPTSVPELTCEEAMLPPSLTEPIEPILNESPSNDQDGDHHDKSTNEIINKDIKLEKQETPKETLEENLEDMIEESKNEKDEDNLDQEKEFIKLQLDKGDNKSQLDNVDNKSQLDNDDNKEECSNNMLVVNESDSKEIEIEKFENIEKCDNDTTNPDGIKEMEVDASKLEMQGDFERKSLIQNVNDSFVEKEIESTHIRGQNGNEIVHDTRQSLDDLDLDDPSDDEETNQLTASNPLSTEDQALQVSIPDQTEKPSFPTSDGGENHQSETQDQVNQKSISDQIEETVVDSVSDASKEKLGRRDDTIEKSIQIESNQIEKSVESNQDDVSRDNDDARTIDPDKNNCTSQKESSKEALANDDNQELLEENNKQGDWGDWGNEDLNEMETEETNSSTPAETADVISQASGKNAKSKGGTSTTTATNISKQTDEWGWDSWADDFIIQAAGKVTNLLETVEGQLGIPDPAKMAKAVSTEEQSKIVQTNQQQQQQKPATERPQQSSTEKTAPSGSSWFSGFGTSLSGLVQNTGSELVTGGIGALEFIGKKTVDMLSDGDPGLRQTRDALSGKNKTNLSALLREAKDSSSSRDITKSSVKKGEGEDGEVNFNDLFEKFQGNAHLDALEMLSNECENKLERILRMQSSEAKQETTGILSGTKERFLLSENVDDEDDSPAHEFKKDLFAFTKQLKMKVTCSKLLNCWMKLKEKSTTLSTTTTSQQQPEADQVLNTTVSGLAELTSRCVEFYRKVADMLLTTDMQAKELAFQRAVTMRSIATILIVEINKLANDLAHQVADNGDASSSSTQKVVTDIYLEGSNCCSLVKDCHDLLLPILQCCIVK